MRSPIALLLALAISSAAAPARADLTSKAIADLTAEGGEAKSRVAAATLLGKLRTPAGRGALERSLGDSDAKVRGAIVASLKAFGDPVSLPPLRSASERETDAALKTSIAAAMKVLEARKPKTKFLIALGPVHDRAGAGDAAQAVVRQKVLDRLVDVPGVEIVADGDEAATVAAAKGRRLPALALDPTLARLTRTDGRAGYSARVEVGIRKLPDQVIAAFLGGGGEALGGMTTTDAVLAGLSADAIGAAVESALAGAKQALEAASKK